MKRKLFKRWIFSLLVPVLAQGQVEERSALFRDALASGDTVKQRMILENWERVAPEEAEYYTSAFNYWFNRSREEVIAFKSDPSPYEQGFAINDSSGAVIGYMVSQVNYDSVLVARGLEIISRGIVRYPDRLDMRFGYAYALSELARWDAMTEVLMEAIDHGGRIAYGWQWTDGAPMEDGEAVFVGSIQDFQAKLFDTWNDSLLVNIQQIAARMLRQFPDRVESLTNLGTAHILLGQYDAGLATLLRAAELAPEDPIVIGNLATGYANQGNTAQAIVYFERLAAMDDPNAAAFAREQLELLRK